MFSQLFFLLFFPPRLLNTQNEKEKPQTEIQLKPSWDHCSVYLSHSHTPLVPVYWELVQTIKRHTYSSPRQQKRVGVLFVFCGAGDLSQGLVRAGRGL